MYLIDTRKYDDSFLLAKILEKVDITDEEKKKLFKHFEKPEVVDTEPVVRCKDCKYFYYNKAYNIQGFPIMGNSVCDKWASGCRTDENGYCFLGERKEDA